MKKVKKTKKPLFQKTEKMEKVRERSF